MGHVIPAVTLSKALSSPLEPFGGFASSDADAADAADASAMDCLARFLLLGCLLLLVTFGSSMLLLWRHEAQLPHWWQA